MLPHRREVAASGRMARQLVFCGNCGLFRLKAAQGGSSKRPKVAQGGSSKRSKVAQSGPKWPKVVHGGPHWRVAGPWRSHRCLHSSRAFRAACAARILTPTGPSTAAPSRIASCTTARISGGSRSIDERWAISGLSGADPARMSRHGHGLGDASAETAPVCPRRAPHHGPVPVCTSVSLMQAGSPDGPSDLRHGARGQEQSERQPNPSNAPIPFGV